jgi:hypothetical protein
MRDSKAGGGKVAALPFDDGELRLLADLAEEHQLPPAAVLKMLRLEHGFYRSGRRKGLFPALREIVDLLATEATPSTSEPDALR